MGIEHVRLSYLYLDEGDIDGYLSLLPADVSLHLPGEAEIRGRERIAAFHAQPTLLDANHLIRHIIGSGDLVAVEGRYQSGRITQGVDFIDVFSLTGEALLRSKKRYYFVPVR